MEEVGLETMPENLGKPTNDFRKTSFVYAIFFFIISSIFIGIWSLRPDKYFTKTAYRKFKHVDSNEPICINFTVSNKNPRQNISKFYISLNFAVVEFLHQYRDIRFTYFGSIFVQSKIKNQTIELKPAFHYLKKINNSIFTEDLILCSFDSIFYEKIYMNLTFDVSEFKVTSAGIKLGHEYDVDKDFMEYLQKVLLIEISLLTVFSIITCQNSIYLYVLEVFIIASLIIYRFNIEFLSEFSSSLIFAAVFNCFTWSNGFYFIQILMTMVVFGISLASNFYSFQIVILPLVLLMSFIFYFLFIKKTPNSAYYTAFLFAFFVIIPNPLAKIGFCIGAAIIYFFMKSDNYWLTVICLIIMPIAFVFPIFEPFTCRMNLLQDPYQRSFNYSSFYGKQLGFSIVRNINPENASSCVIILGNQALNDHLRLASRIKTQENQLLIELADFSNNSYDKEQASLLRKSKSVVLNIGDKKGFNNINLIYDFLNVHYLVFDRVTIINYLVAKQNPADLIDISKIKSFSGESAFVKSYFGCRLNQTEDKCQNIIEQYKTSHPEENNFYFNQN